MSSYHSAVRGSTLALTALLCGTYSPADAEHRPWVEAQKISSAAVACYFVGRAFLNSPVNGQGEVVAYFTNINGIPGPLFKGGLGAASEKTAFFTLRSDVFSTTSLPLNGDVAPAVVSAGKFNIYYNLNPNGDWSNPDTFSGRPTISYQPTDRQFHEARKPRIANLANGLCHSAPVRIDNPARSHWNLAVQSELCVQRTELRPRCLDARWHHGL